MDNISKENINQEVFDLYDEYAHNRLSRRDFYAAVVTLRSGRPDSNFTHEFSNARLQEYFADKRQ